MLAAYATCDDYPHNAYPGRFLNFKIYLLFGVHAGIIIFFIFWAPSLGSQLGPSLGPAWAQLGPGLGPAWAQLGPGLGPAWARAWAQLGLGPGLGPK